MTKKTPQPMVINKIEKKILSEKRLSPEDARALFQSDDIFTIGRLANIVAMRNNGRNAYFIRNHHINPTNICVNRCKFCAFSRSKGEKGAYELSIKEIIKKLKVQRAGRGQVLNRTPQVSEVHIVGGLHPDWTFDFYLQMLEQIKRALPDIHIKAFTAVEIDHFAKISRLGLKETIRKLKAAGLDSIPGGGAEIFNTRVRNQICPEKISGKRWLDVMENAHIEGIRSNATMLYGHLENSTHRVEHMAKVRDLQDRTGGFQAFIPLAFHSMNTKLGIRDNGLGDKKTEIMSQGAGVSGGYTSGIDDLKTIAISRLFLDNIQHIKAYWIMLGEKIAQLALMFGADDLDGTIIEEKITHSAGALSGSAMSRSQFVNLIEKAGKVPVERDSYYRPLRK